MIFREVRMDMRISYESESGPTYRTTIIDLPNGQEFRRGWWSSGRKKWRIKKELLSREDVRNLENFFRAMRGRLFGFRIRDWNSYLAVNETLDPLTPTTAQLRITYRELVTGVIEFQNILKPVLLANVNNSSSSDTFSPDITLRRNGVAWPSAGNWTLNRATGVVTYNVSQTGQTILWSGSYDWPVRFATDEAMFNREALDIHDWSDITLIELKQ